MDRRRFLSVILPLVLTVIPGLQLVRFFSQKPDIWWTPPSMLVSLADGEGQVRVYARNTPLRSMLQSGQVQIVTGAQATPMTEADIGLRLNHWDQVRARNVGMLILCGLMVGLCLGLAMAGLVGLRQQPERAATS